MPLALCPSACECGCKQQTPGVRKPQVAGRAQALKRAQGSAPNDASASIPPPLNADTQQDRFGFAPRTVVGDQRPASTSIKDKAKFASRPSSAHQHSDRETTQRGCNRFPSLRRRRGPRDIHSLVEDWTPARRPTPTQASGGSPSGTKTPRSQRDLKQMHDLREEVSAGTWP